ncbi:MAG: glycogen synthase [Clostridia bacterium]|nr:glycogen synthase [Clostridia bacterium]
MKILYVTSEANPFAASGGLGDVMGALPITVAKEEGIKAEVIMPLYDTMKKEHRDSLTWVCDLSFKLSWRQTGATVYKTERLGVTYYFVENHYYFERGRLYGEFDDGERFAFFSRAVIEFILSYGEVPDVLHANDWQTALTVIYLKTEYKNIERFNGIKTVFTIHNIEYQGKYDPYILGDVFGLDFKYRDIVEYDGCINLLKGAIVTCDHLTTVSPNYANELTHDFFAFGLSKVILEAKPKMSGIINGIDYGYFSPEEGGDIYESYRKNNYKSGKAKNKAALQAELSLPVKKNVPLVVMITRLTAGKGIDLVLHILEELLAENVQVVILGTGDKEYEDKLSEIAKRHENLRALIKFDRVLSKKMYAAADIFLMPSKSEPCGLAQMIACSYGTVPVVRSVGGLFDSIRTVGEEGANGFRFDNYNAHEMLFTIKAALALYENKEEWGKLTKAAKNSSFTWEKSAKNYIEIYKKGNIK